MIIIMLLSMQQLYNIIIIVLLNQHNHRASYCNFQASIVIDNLYWWTLFQSKRNAEIGATERARKQGVIAAYLNVIAIVIALVVDCLIMVLALVYGIQKT